MDERQNKEEAYLTIWANIQIRNAQCVVSLLRVSVSGTCNGVAGPGCRIFRTFQTVSNLLETLVNLQWQVFDTPHDLPRRGGRTCRKSETENKVSDMQYSEAP